MEQTNQPILNWEVIEKPIYGNNRVLAGYKGVFRNDNGKLLNVAKNSYTPTSNTKFIEVAQRLNEITGFPIQDYYELEGGKKTLAFLKCTEPIQVCGYEFKDYLMLGNSFDGSTGFFIGNSSMMVRCKNRFSKKFRQLQVNHTKNHSFKIDALCQAFEMFMDERKKLFTQMEKFNAVRVDNSLKRALVERLAKMSEEEKLGNEQAIISTRKSNIIAQITHSIETECRDLGNNALGLFNGITHYTTHIKSSKNATFGNPFGVLNDLNQNAFKFCLELC